MRNVILAPLIVTFYILAQFSCLPAHAWLIRPASPEIEGLVADAKAIDPPVSLNSTWPLIVTKWPGATRNKTSHPAVFITAPGQHESNTVYMLDPNITWRFGPLLSLADSWEDDGVEHSQAREVTAQGPTGNQAFILTYKWLRAALYQPGEDFWRLPASFFDAFTPLELANSTALANRRLKEEILTPAVGPMEVGVLREQGANATGPIVALTVKHTGQKAPGRTVFLAPRGGVWATAKIMSVEFTGREDAFSIVRLTQEGHGGCLAHLNPWRGFIAYKDQEPSLHDAWTAGRPILARPEEEAATDLHSWSVPEVKNATATPFAPGRRMAPVGYDLSWYVSNVYNRKAFSLSANSTYSVSIKKIPHTEDLEEIHYCSPKLDTRVFIVLEPKTARRAVWELTEECRWREQRWLYVPDKPGPDEYALIEYEVPYFNENSHHKDAFTGDGVTTYIVGLNPWRAFIAEAVPQAGQPKGAARVEPPDFAPLAGLPADLFPGKTLRLLEQAVWPR